MKLFLQKSGEEKHPVGYNVTNFYNPTVATQSHDCLTFLSENLINISMAGPEIYGQTVLPIRRGNLIISRNDIRVRMPDISMCFGKGCPLRERCVRCLSELDGDDQTYFCGTPYADGKCKWFWEVRE